MRVVGALYGVTLAVSTAEPQGGPSVPSTNSVPARDTKRTPGRSRAAHKAAKRATTVSASRRRRLADTTPTGSTGSAPDNAEVRSWARQSGLAISDRGRIPASVMTAYHDSHG